VLSAGRSETGANSLIPEFDDVSARSQVTFDKQEQLRLIARSHEIIVDKAAFLFHSVTI